jgi:hypothetical protein
MDPNHPFNRALTRPAHRKQTRNMIMPKPPLDPPVADQAPTAGDLTDYDREHLVTYLRLLDAGRRRCRLGGSGANGAAY